ncbi:MAG TPA: UDP-N-acetylmuramate dehydrogenase [Cytophagaceae bacterium]|jgi:UDP-N-acetylmuramate dehydrogenase
MNSSFISNVSLRPYNTFGIDATARLFSVFGSVDELKQILQSQEVKQNPLLVLGGGSNMLLTRDFDGVVLKNEIKGIEIVGETSDSIIVKSGAGEVWHDLVLFTIERDLGGIENLSLIPGTVGASPMQNIGAYGVEIKDTFVSLEALNIQTGELETFDKDACHFGYRESVFKKSLKGKYIITSVDFRLNKQPKFNTSYGAIQTTLEEMGVKQPTVKSISEAVCKIRRSKLPDPAQIGNAGSFFKNPEIPEAQYLKLKDQYPEIPSFNTVPGYVKVPAGWLNEQCGWKGKVVGNTGVHKNQALVLVNHGGANGSEVKALSQEIVKSVKEKFGIELETEVNII